MKRKSGELSSAEQEELAFFLSNNPEFTQLSDIVDDLYNTPFKEAGEIDKVYLQQRWESLQRRMPEEQPAPQHQAADTVTKQRAAPAKTKTVIRRLKYIAAAASVAAILTLGYFQMQQNKDHSAEQLTVVTENGSKKKMTLPDGSTVWLNAGSKISYYEDSDRQTRNVRLLGEAYFDVAHDAGHPFIVHTNDFQIKVLGTAFNVKDYSTDEKSEAALLRGLIELSFNNGSSRTIRLHPNEKLTFRSPDKIETDAAKSNISPEIVVTQLQKLVKDSATVETQWMHNRLAFKNSKLKDIAQQLSRWYDVDVLILNSELENKEFSGIFEEESVVEVMDALKLAGGFSYKINNNTITIE